MLTRGLLCLAVAFAIAISACSEGESSLPVVEIPARWNDSAARDLTSLLEATGTVFIGQVTAKTSQSEWAPPRLAGGSAPDGNTASHGPTGFPISRFAVRVLEPLAGRLEAGETITVEQPGGNVVDASGLPALAMLEGDTPLRPGARYLFFARPKDNGTYSAPPFARFEISEGGRLIAPMAWADSGVAIALDETALPAARQEVLRAAP